MRIYNVITQKGGTGKSETVKNLAYGLSQKGLKVLVVDLDPQANTTSTILKSNKTITKQAMEEMKKEYADKVSSYSSGREGIDVINQYMIKNTQGLDVSDVLVQPTCIKAAIRNTSYNNLDILPSSSKLIETDLRLKLNNYESDKRLQKAFSEISYRYDICIIDNTPYINAITINGITACKNEGDTVIVPIKLENGSLEGVDTTLQQMLEILSFSSSLEFDFKLLFTMRNRNKLETELEDMLRFLFPDRCYNQSIRYQAKPVVTASLEKKILIESDNSSVAEDYRRLVDEVFIEYKNFIHSNPQNF